MPFTDVLPSVLCYMCQFLTQAHRWWRLMDHIFRAVGVCHNRCTCVNSLNMVAVLYFTHNVVVTCEVLGYLCSQSVNCCVNKNCLAWMSLGLSRLMLGQKRNKRSIHTLIYTYCTTSFKKSIFLTTLSKLLPSPVLNRGDPRARQAGEVGKYSQII